MTQHRRQICSSIIMLSWSHAILIHDLLCMNATYHDADMPVFNDTDQTRLTQRSDILMAYLILLKDSSKFLNFLHQPLSYLSTKSSYSNDHQWHCPYFRVLTCFQHCQAMDWVILTQIWSRVWAGSWGHLAWIKSSCDMQTQTWLILRGSHRDHVL